MAAPSPPFAERYAALYPPELCTPERAESGWWDWRGVAVHVNRIPAADAPCVVVIAHGAGGYGEMFRCFADLVRAEKERSARPVVLFGGSMGGMLAYETAATVGVDGLMATCLLDVRDPRVLRHVARFGLLGPLAGPALRAARWLTDRVRVPIRRLTRMSAMSNDPRLSALVASDPSGGGSRVSLRFLRTFLASAPSVEPEDFDVCPVVLVHPGSDRWTPVGTSLPFFERIAAPKELVMLENCGHLPIEQPGLDQLCAAARRHLDGLS